MEQINETLYDGRIIKFVKVIEKGELYLRGYIFDRKKMKTKNFEGKVLKGGYLGFNTSKHYKLSPRDRQLVSTLLKKYI